MTKAKRESGSHRGFYICTFCAVAALGLVLAACGGGSADSASAPAAASGLGSTPGLGATAAPGAAPTSTNSLASSSSGKTSSTGASIPMSATAKAVTINWTPPTENMDGTTLTDLAGYDILYGTASGYYTQKISVPNPGIAAYVVDDLAPGTYYFSVAAVNSSGTESPISAEVRATVN